MLAGDQLGGIVGDLRHRVLDELGDGMGCRSTQDEVVVADEQAGARRGAESAIDVLERLGRGRLTLRPGREQSSDVLAEIGELVLTVGQQQCLARDEPAADEPSGGGLRGVQIVGLLAVPRGRRSVAQGETDVLILPWSRRTWGDGHVLTVTETV